ncbi:hypothetical protein KH5_06250 [Urechidicola sp. KH5]
MNLVSPHNNSSIVRVENCSILLISSAYGLRKEQLNDYDGFIINVNEENRVLEIIKYLRTVKNIKNALKPLFVNSIYKLSKNILDHTDGYISLENLPSYLQPITVMNKRIEQINYSFNLDYTDLLKLKITAFCFTRNAVLEPFPSRKSLIGFEYPFISTLFKEKDELAQVTLLNQMSKDKLLSQSFFDQVHLCKNCNGNYLNIRECCPNCNSIDIEEEDMIHHFVCAHISVESKFKSEDDLICPKCYRKLRHIGVDYDKPSSIFKCNSCNTNFQNHGMKSLCIDCNTEQKIDELTPLNLKVFGLTQIGENFLKHGKSLSQNPEKLDYISIPVFKILLNQEITRIKNFGNKSQFVVIEFKNSSLEVLNKKIKSKLSIEIQSIISSYLKDTDILTSKRFNLYYLLLPETKGNKIERLELIHYNLTKLLNDNIEFNQKPIDIYIQELSEKSEVNKLLQNVH